jgi:alpha-ketoglutarate-dependent taurine dioxygenase
VRTDRHDVEWIEPVQDASPGAVSPASFPVIVDNGRTALDLAAGLAWIEAHRAWALQAAAAAGVVVFRALPVETPDDFDAFVRAFGLPNFPHAESLSNAVRTNLTERVFTANEAPPDAVIGLHHEMAQTPIHPSRLFFFCAVPAERGGATVVCRSDRLHAALRESEPAFVEACEAKGLTYSLVMPPRDDPGSPVGRSWRSTFGVDDRAGAEARMRRLGYAWSWVEDDGLRTTTPVLPAVRDLGGGRRSLFNQLIAARGWSDARNSPASAVRFGDGGRLPDAAWARVGEVAATLSFDLEWQRGDVALVDNRVVMHGRKPFVGRRELLASLVAPED